MLLDGGAARGAREPRAWEMSQTTATSRVASGVPVHASTSSTACGGSRRSRPGTRFGEDHVVDGNGWNPGTAMRTPSWVRTIS